MIRYTSNNTKAYNINSRKALGNAASSLTGDLKDSSTISLKKQEKKKVVNRNNNNNNNNSNYVRKYLGPLFL